MDSMSKEDFICSKIELCEFKDKECYHRNPHKQFLYYGHASNCQTAGSCGPCIQVQSGIPSL